MRRAFADTLTLLADQDPRIILLTGDLGFGVFDDYQAKYPDRFINVGICEQAMVDIAAGLALEGYKPIVYSIASFMTGRAWEQIKVSLAYQKLPVVVVGAGGGYTYSKAGTTHHAAEDLGLMSLIPGMVVTAPGCPSEVSQLLPQLVELDGPSYMRIGKYGEKEYDALEPAVVGKARLLRKGKGLTLVTTGDMASLALEIEGPTVYQMHTVKPLDVETLETIRGDIIVCEDHSPYGGLYASMTMSRISGIGRFGPNDVNIKTAVEPKELREFRKRKLEELCKPYL